MIAVSCGMPIPATTRVVQMEPGPIPHFYDVRPCADERFGRLRRRDVARHDGDIGILLLDILHHLGNRKAVAVRRIHGDDIYLCLDQLVHAFVRIARDADRRADDQAAVFILCGIGILDGFFDILDGDEPAQIVRPHPRSGASRS